MSGKQKLEWAIETNKETYQPCEPVRIRVSLRNISTEDVTIWKAHLMPDFFLNSMEINRIFKDVKRDAHLSEGGFRLYVEDFGEMIYRPMSGGGILKPGDSLEVDHPFKTINRYYDISETGEYELAFYTRDFLADDEHQLSEYPKPCTIRFKIEGHTNWLDQHVKWPEED